MSESLIMHAGTVKPFGVLRHRRRFYDLISTSLLERLNLTIRHSLAPLGRKTLNFCKKRDNLKKLTIFFQAYYNFARPHMSLREKVEIKEQLFVQRWAPGTPGMAAGLTDRVWSFRELLTFKSDHAP